MKVSIAYKEVESHQHIETECARYAAKLERLLSTYEPDLVHLHGVYSRDGRDFAFALNLSLPTGVLHAVACGADARGTCKKAFSELEKQIKKHQQLLRKDFEWKRKRRRPSIETVTA